MKTGEKLKAKLGVELEKKQKLVRKKEAVELQGRNGHPRINILFRKGFVNRSIEIRVLTTFVSNFKVI